MRAVAIDTSSRRASVALWEAGTVLAQEVHEDRSLHAENVLGLIEACFRATGWSRTSVDVCVCGIGPGSFTGVRVGLATAKGLAVGLERPLVGVGSLDAMTWGVSVGADAGTVVVAEAAVQTAGIPILALVDAGRGQFFGALYGPDRRPRGAPSLFQSGQMIPFLDASVEGDSLLAIGEVADRAIGTERGRLTIRTVRGQATDLPDAGRVAALGIAKLAAAGPDNLDQLEPCYGRAPDITTPKNG